MSEPVFVAVRIKSGLGDIFEEEARVDRQKRGLAVTQRKWVTGDYVWSVTHVASGRSLNTNPLKLRDARWLFAEALKLRIPWTLKATPLKHWLKAHPKKRASAGFLRGAAEAFSEDA
jgi:hypothetical protein